MAGSRTDRVTRLVAVFSLLLVAVLLAGGWVFHGLLERGLRESSRRHLRAQGQLIARALADPAGPVAAWERLDPEALRVAAGLDRLALHDTRGRALGADALWGMAAPDLPDSMLADLGLGLETMPPPQRVGDELYQLLALPLPGPDGEPAAFLVLESGEAVSARLQALRRGLWWATVLGALFVAFVLLAMAGILRQARRRQRELDRAEHLAEVGTLAAGLAHEIRNPLAIIAGSAELLLEPSDTERAQRRAADIVSESDRLQRLLDDFLKVARPGDLRREPVDLVALWRRAVDEQGGLHPSIDFSFDAPGSLPRLEADPDRLRQLALNLLANAGRAARKAVRVSLSRGGDNLRVRVADDGPGVPEELLPRLYEPFVSGSEGGSGLGLAVCAAVARAHGGHLRLDANGPDGAVFTLELPL